MGCIDQGVLEDERGDLTDRGTVLLAAQLLDEAADELGLVVKQNVSSAGGGVGLLDLRNPETDLGEIGTENLLSLSFCTGSGPRLIVREARCLYERSCL